MKSIILVFFFLGPLVTFAQFRSFRIEGETVKVQQPYYAYLYFNNTIEKNAIQNGKFTFSGKVKVGDSGYEAALLIVVPNENMNVQEAEVIKKSGSRYSKNIIFYRLVLEDIDVNIEDFNKINELKITGGGNLTKLIKESSSYISEDRILDFYKKYPNSPVSASLLAEMLKLYHIGGSTERIKNKFPVKAAYELLSDSLKQTPYVKRIKLDMDQVAN